LSLPMYPELSQSQIEKVSEAAVQFLGQFETREVSVPATHG